MLELYTSLNPLLLLYWMMTSILALVFHGRYWAWLQGRPLVRCFEGAIILHLLLLSLILRMVKIQTVLCFVLIEAYVPLRWGLSLLILVLGMVLWVKKRNAAFLTGILFTLMTLPILEQLPYRGFTLCLIFSVLGFLFRGYLLSAKEREKRSSALTEYAIKEAFDAQHSGIMFSEKNGNILLINKQMLSIMKELTGTHLRNGKTFIDLLHQHEDKEKMPFTYHGQGTLWQISQERIQRKGKELIQTIATDITHQEEINQALSRQQGRLNAQQEALKLALHQEEELRQQESIEQMWHHVHHVLGQRISILHRTLGAEETLKPEALTPLLQGLLENLQLQEASPEEQYEQLAASFSTLHISLERTGGFPKDPMISMFFIQVIKEGVINAVRHGQAQHINIELVEAQDYLLRISNDGKKPPEKFTLGNGIHQIKRKAKIMEGSLEIKLDPQFSLCLRLPKTAASSEG
ncbi:MAG: hypothetical protein RR472_07955 [Anaerovoracaceae bacterium]